MSLVRQSIVAAASAILTTGLRFLITAILVRRLAVEEFGQFAFAQWLVDISFLICSFGSTGAVSRYVAEHRGDSHKLNSFLKAWRPWAMSAPCGAAGVVLFGASWSGYTLNTFSILALALWALTNGINAMLQAVFTGFQRFDLGFYSNLTATVLTLIGSMLLPQQYLSAQYLFLLLGMAYLVSVMPGLYFLKKNITAHNETEGKNEWNAVRKYALNMWLVALLWSFVWSRGEFPVVKHYLGSNGVAGYAAVLSLFGGAIQGVMLGMSAVAPQLTRLWGENQHKEAVALARKVMDGQLLICSAVGLTMIYLGQEILQLFYGKRYLDQVSTLAILSVGLVAMSLSNQNHLLQIATNGRFSRNSALFGLALLMTLALVFIPNGSVFGAGAARAGTMLSMAWLSIATANRKLSSLASSISSFGLVSLLLVLAALSQKFFPSIEVPIRIGLLLISIILTFCVVRDVDGSPTMRRFLFFVAKRRLS